MRTRVTRSRVGAVLGIAGELLLTVGVAVTLYGVYQLFWTNVAADRAATAAVEQLRESWLRSDPPVSDRDRAPAPSGQREGGRGVMPHPIDVRSGEAFALLRIPRLGTSYVQPIIEGSGGGPGGISDDELARGVVHYPKTALPGQPGNFAVAGHRATRGEPFARLDQLHHGDTITVRIGAGSFVYAVTSRRIVSPTRTDVLRSRPAGSSSRETLTLTTCHPRWSSSQRLVVHARLVEQTSGRGERPPGSSNTASKE